jgi:hypothetical protein
MASNRIIGMLEFAKIRKNATPILNFLAYFIVTLITYIRGGAQAYLVNFDSVYNVAVVKNSFKFGSFGISLQGDFLQSLGNVQLGIIHWFNPFAIGGTVFSSGFSIAAALTTVASLLYISTVILARTMRVRQSAAALAGFVVSFTMLGINPFTVSTFNKLQPAATVLLVICNFYLALAINLHNGNNKVFWSKALVLCILFLYSATVFVEYAAVILPVLTFISICALIHHGFRKNRHAFLRHVRAQILLIAVVLLTGVLPMNAGLILYSSSIIFKSEMIFRKFSETTSINPFLSFFIDRGIVSFAMALFSVACLIIATRDKTTSISNAAKWTLIAIAGIVGYQLVFTASTNEIGPSPQYFAFFVWPAVWILVSDLILRLLENGFGKGRMLKRFWSVTKYVGPITFAAWTILWIARNPNMGDTEVPFYADKSELVNVIDSSIGLSDNNLFRGRSATFLGDLPNNAREANNLATFQNQYLYQHGIPVLDEYSHGETGQFAQFAKYFFMNKSDQMVRNFIPYRVFDPSILQLIGVQFLFSDTAISGQTSMASGGFREPKFTYKLPNPNVGNYSPTNIYQAKTYDESFDRMSNADFDPTSDVVLTNEKRIDGALVAATEAKLTVERGGLNVKATSAGKSLLVLPVEYSNCMRFDSRTESQYEIKRVNGILVGLMFNQTVDVDIEYRLGYSMLGSCRIDDLFDFRLLNE